MVDPREKLFSVKSYADYRDWNGRILSKSDLTTRLQRKEKMLDRLVRVTVEKFPMIFIGKNESAVRFLLNNPRVSPETFMSLLHTGNGNILQAAAQTLHTNPGLDVAVFNILELHIPNDLKRYLIDNPHYYVVNDYYNEVLLVLAAANVPNNEIKWLAVLSIFKIVIEKRGPSIAAQILYEAFSTVDTLQEMAAYFCNQLGVSSAKNSITGDVAPEIPMDKDVLDGFATRTNSRSDHKDSRDSITKPKFGDGKQYKPTTNGSTRRTSGLNYTEVHIGIRRSNPGSGLFDRVSQSREDSLRHSNERFSERVGGFKTNSPSDVDAVKSGKMSRDMHNRGSRDMTDEEIESHLFKGFDDMKF